MYEVRMTKTFRKDTERCRKRGYDMEHILTDEWNISLRRTR